MKAAHRRVDVRSVVGEPGTFHLLRRAGRASLVVGAIALVLVSAVVGAGVAWWRPWRADADVVARVNGEPVTRAQLQRLLADPASRRQLEQEYGDLARDAKALERLAVRQLVFGRLMLQEGGRRGIAVSEQDIDRHIAGLRTHAGSADAFRASLAQRGLDERSLRDVVRAEMVMVRAQQALVAAVRVSDDEVTRYYEKHSGELNTGDEVRLNVIAVEGPTEAAAIQTALRNGVDFERLARTRSRAFRAEHGGDIGWISPTRLPPAVRDAVSSLKVGETAAPVQAGAQFLIVRLADRRTAHPRPLAEVRPAIERALMTAKQREALRAWLAERERTSKIEVLYRPS